MAATVAGPEIERLIQLLARLPGLGPRSARRVALHLINKREHLLGRVLSALDGVRPEHLSLDKLVARASEPGVTEVILALNATVDGQTTAHYVTELLGHLPIKVTRLAHGVPVGGELDYLDEGTLSAAIRQRTTL